MIGIAIEGCDATESTSVLPRIRSSAATNTLDTPSQWWGPSAASGIDIEVEGYDIFGPAPHQPFVRDVLIEDNYIVRTETRTAGTGDRLQPAYGPISDVVIRGNYISGHQSGVETTGALDIYGESAGVERLTIEGDWITVEAVSMSRAGRSLWTVSPGRTSVGTRSTTPPTGKLLGGLVVTTPRMLLPKTM